jgi:hypothetical protein
VKSLLGKLGAVLIGFAIFGNAEVWGAVEDDRASLKGLKGFYVFIDGQLDPLIREGLTKEQLKTDVELQLRKAGIKVLTEQESVALPGAPWLSITLSVSEGACGVSHSDSSLKFYAIGFLIQFYQEVRLDSNPKMKIKGITWKTVAIGWGEAKKIKNFIREGVKDGIDLFMNDYLTVNPK